jgi:hypothetical protein
MRNMKTHPKDAILPGGLVMSGNTFARNIFFYRTSAALYRFGNFPFEHNESDRNLVWHDGKPIATGQAKAGKGISANLQPNGGFEDGAVDAMPKDWGWQARPSNECKAAASEETPAEGKRSLRIDGVAAPGAKCVPPWPVVVGKEIAVQPGHAYKLTAKMRADKPNTRGELAIQSYVANVYYWERRSSASLGREWKEVELTFRFPAAGDHDYKEQMKLMRPRIDLPGGVGTIWIDDVALVEVEALDEWQSLQALGWERNSVVTDPMFVAPEKDDWRLKPDSPALKLGFKPIPVEKIGPYQDPLRASWPIVETSGAREWLAGSAGKP